MSDISDARVLYLKGFLFLALGILASLILLLDNPSWKAACLLSVAVWSFARAYYFAFYVIERYVDRSYRFAGLWSFVRYVMTARSHDPALPR